MGNKPWQKVGRMGGYVTQWSALKYLSITKLEAALGFNPGALKYGYAVYGLADKVGIDDFEWRDRTRYSGGWHADRTIEFGTAGLVWSVQRIDELRAALGKKLNYSESAVDEELKKIKMRWLTEMNTCFGDKQIVKVLSVARIGSFPDSPMLGVPQWEFRKGIQKNFKILFEN